MHVLILRLPRIATVYAMELLSLKTPQHHLFPLKITNNIELFVRCNWDAVNLLTGYLGAPASRSLSRCGLSGLPTEESSAIGGLWFSFGAGAGGI
jgi:hypothetical protein